MASSPAGGNDEAHRQRASEQDGEQQSGEQQVSEHLQSQLHQFSCGLELASPFALLRNFTCLCAEIIKQHHVVEELIPPFQLKRVDKIFFKNWYASNKHSQANLHALLKTKKLRAYQYLLDYCAEETELGQPATSVTNSLRSLYERAPYATHSQLRHAVVQGRSSRRLDRGKRPLAIHNNDVKAAEKALLKAGVQILPLPRRMSPIEERPTTAGDQDIETAESERTSEAKKPIEHQSGNLAGISQAVTPNDLGQSKSEDHHSVANDGITRMRGSAVPSPIPDRTDPKVMSEEALIDDDDGYTLPQHDAVSDDESVNDYPPDDEDNLSDDEEDSLPDVEIGRTAPKRGCEDDRSLLRGSGKRRKMNSRDWSPQSCSHTRSFSENADPSLDIDPDDQASPHYELSSLHYQASFSSGRGSSFQAYLTPPVDGPNAEDNLARTTDNPQCKIGSLHSAVAYDRNEVTEGLKLADTNITHQTSAADEARLQSNVHDTRSSEMAKDPKIEEANTIQQTSVSGPRRHRGHEADRLVKPDDVPTRKEKTPGPSRLGRNDPKLSTTTGPPEQIEIDDDICSPAEEIDNSRFDRLKGSGWLNDDIIDCTLNLWNIEPHHDFVVPSFLLRTDPSSRHENATLKLGHFKSQHRLVIPLNHRRSHWTVAVVESAKRIVSIYDPLQDRKHRMSSEQAVRSFLPSITKQAQDDFAYVPTNWQFRQNDFHSCGLLVLIFAISSLRHREPPATVCPPLWRAFFEAGLRAKYDMQRDTAPPSANAILSACADASADGTLAGNSQDAQPEPRINSLMQEMHTLDDIIREMGYMDALLEEFSRALSSMPPFDDLATHHSTLVDECRRAGATAMLRHLESKTAKQALSEDQRSYRIKHAALRAMRTFVTVLQGDAQSLREGLDERRRSTYEEWRKDFAVRQVAMAREERRMQAYQI